ncbi:MAG: ferritin-like domain-containing protein [Hydrogenothermaceae bacterium]|nr:ferritin-like domain-containing protein [Hydrogenothermaceae bacterium]
MIDSEREKIIQYLNYNISLEHSAIIQYLFHAYTIGDPEIENEIEEIAREEMRHLRMFAHRVVELGGKPSIFDRATVFLSAPTYEELMQLNIDAEMMAIEEYKRQREEITDQSTRKILARAIEDETSHSTIFKKMKDNLKSIAKNSSSEVDENMARVVQLLNELLQKQYKKILEHLFQSFVLRHKNPILSDEIEQKAIDQMKHFGWIAEEISEKGFSIDVSLPKATVSENPEEVIKYTKQEEIDSQNEYRSVANRMENPELSLILQRIANREIHYTDLERFLKNEDISERAASEIIRAFTVGSLFKKGG